MRMHAEKWGIDITVDSAGTGRWHIGNQPDFGSIGVASRNGIDITGQRARQVLSNDFHRFDYIVAMDRTNNLADLKALQPQDGKAILSLLLDYHPEETRQDVPDPYGGDDAAFTEVWGLVMTATEHLLDQICDRDLSKS